MQIRGVNLISINGLEQWIESCATNRGVISSNPTHVYGMFPDGVAKETTQLNNS